jgi:pimeloyl-ACP methyl ester carboxylesterase
MTTTKPSSAPDTQGGGTATSADGTPIAWASTGSGPVVVTVDPALGSSASRQSEALVAVLAEAFTVVTYDRRGRGGSGDTAPYDVAREVEDLAAVAAATAAAGALPYVYGLSSGGLLALQAAAAGVPMARLAVFEPPLPDDVATRPGGWVDPLTRELEAILAEGRNGDAVDHFMASIGMPEEARAGMRATPAWAAFAAVAPTLLYDCALGERTGLAVVADVTVPTLVVDSLGSSADLTGWAAAIMGALPDGTHVSLPGEWHGVSEADLAKAVGDFFRS